MAVPAKRNAVSKKYDELAAELENLVRDGLDENCSEESRKRLHEAVRLAQPELEKFDDALHRIIHAVRSPLKLTKENQLISILPANGPYRL